MRMRPVHHPPIVPTPSPLGRRDGEPAPSGRVPNRRVGRRIGLAHDLGAHHLQTVVHVLGDVDVLVDEGVEVRVVPLIAVGVLS